MIGIGEIWRQGVLALQEMRRPRPVFQRRNLDVGWQTAHGHALVVLHSDRQRDRRWLDDRHGHGNSWYDEQRILATATLSLLIAGYFNLRSVPSLVVTWVHLLCSSWVAGVGFLIRFDAPVRFRLWWSGATLFLNRSLVTTAIPRSIDVVTSDERVGRLRNLDSLFWLASRATTSPRCFWNGPIGQTLLVGFSNPKFPAHLEGLTRRSSARLYLEPGIGSGVSRPSIASLWWMLLVGSGSRTAWLAPARRESHACSVRKAFDGFECRPVGSCRCRPLGRPVQGTCREHGSSGPQSIIEEVLLSLACDRAGFFGHAWYRFGDCLPLLGVGPMHFAYCYNVHRRASAQLLAATRRRVGTCRLLLIAALHCFDLGLSRLTVDRNGMSQSAVLGTALATAMVVWAVGTQADGFMVVPTSQLMPLFSLC